MVNNNWESANCVDVAEIMTEECLSRQHQKDRHKAEEERLRAQWVAQEKWERDSESDSCRVCEKTFGVFRRRHHCRKCGRLVCGNCSKYAPALCSSSGIIPERLPCLFLQKSQPVFWEICTHLRQLHRLGASSCSASASGSGARASKCRASPSSAGSARGDCPYRDTHYEGSPRFVRRGGPADASLCGDHQRKPADA